MPCSHKVISLCVRLWMRRTGQRLMFTSYWGSLFCPAGGAAQCVVEIHAELQPERTLFSRISTCSRGRKAHPYCSQSSTSSTLTLPPQFKLLLNFPNDLLSSLNGIPQYTAKFSTAATWAMKQVSLYSSSLYPNWSDTEGNRMLLLSFTRLIFNKWLSLYWLFRYIIIGHNTMSSTGYGGSFATAGALHLIFVCTNHVQCRLWALLWMWH